MPANEREWAKQPVEMERILYEEAEKLDGGLEDYELSMTADGFEFRRKEESTFGWWDAVLWVVLLLVAGWFT